MSEIRIEPKSDAKVRKVIRDGLRAFNRPFLGPSQAKPFLVTLRDASGEITGGLVGRLRFDWLYVDQFWLSEGERGKGRGRELLLAAEREAHRRGARKVQLSSWSFQAPEFYKKLGYREFGRLEGHPGGHSDVFLTKAL